MGRAGSVPGDLVQVCGSSAQARLSEAFVVSVHLAGHMRPRGSGPFGWVDGGWKGKRKPEAAGPRSAFVSLKSHPWARGDIVSRWQSTSSWPYLGLYKGTLVFPPQPLTSLCRGQGPPSPPRDLGIPTAPPRYRGSHGSRARYPGWLSQGGRRQGQSLEPRVTAGGALGERGGEPAGAPR